MECKEVALNLSVMTLVPIVATERMTVIVMKVTTMRYDPWRVTHPTESYTDVTKGFGKWQELNNN